MIAPEPTHKKINGVDGYSGTDIPVVPAPDSPGTQDNVHVDSTHTEKEDKLGNSAPDSPDELMEILMTYAGRFYAAKRNGDVGQAQAEHEAAHTAIIKLIEDVIGEDEVRANTLYDKGHKHFARQLAIPARNALRAEQRQRLYPTQIKNEENGDE